MPRVWLYILSWTMVLTPIGGQRSDIEVEELAKQKFMDCKTQEGLRFPEGRDAWYACWDLFIKWKSNSDDLGNLGAIHSPRIREGREGSTPCLTKRGLKMCKKLCGTDLWEVARESLRIEAVEDHKPVTWRSHPWFAACKRNHLMFRCGPIGISCWSGPGLSSAATIREGSPWNLRSGAGIMLPLCRYPNNLTMEVVSSTPIKGEVLPDGNQLKGDFDPTRPFERGFKSSESRERKALEWEKVKRRRRTKFLEDVGYPSIVNFRAEDVTENPEGLLPLNIKRWKTWAGAKELLEERPHEFNLEELKGIRDVRTIKLELRFVRDILRVKTLPDREARWAEHAYDVVLNREPTKLFDEYVEFKFEDVLDRSASLLETVPTETKPFKLWPYHLGLGVTTQEMGARAFTDFATLHAEDYLRTDICTKVHEVAPVMEGSREWMMGVSDPQAPQDISDNFSSFLKLDRLPTPEPPEELVDDDLEEQTSSDLVELEHNDTMELNGNSTFEEDSQIRIQNITEQVSTLNETTMNVEEAVHTVTQRIDEVEGSNLTADHSVENTPETVLLMVAPTESSAQPLSPRMTGVGPSPSEETPRGRGRVNRSTDNQDAQNGNGGSNLPTRGMGTPQNEAFPKNLEERIEKWIESVEDRDETLPRKEYKPYDGLANNLRTVWEGVSQEKELWTELRKEVSQSQITTSKELDGVIMWTKVRDIDVYDQNAILELVAPLSPLVDTMDDLAFHLDVHHAQEHEELTETGQPTGNQNPWFWSSLKSPRSHKDFFKGTKDQLMTKAEEFRLYEQAGIDHTLETNAKIAKHCQQRARLEIYNQGFESFNGKTVVSNLTMEGPVTMIKRSIATAAASIASGIGGLLFGLAAAKPHVGVEVKGLRDAVFNLHQRTGAMIRAESILKSKLLKVDQDVGAARRGIISSTATMAVCEASRAIKDALTRINNRRVPLDLFKNQGEMNTILQDVERNLLDPNGLTLALNRSNYPEQLLSWEAGGHLSVGPRATILQEGAADDIEKKGELGYRWLHNDQILQKSPLSLTSADNLGEHREDLLDHAFQKAAQHKVHKTGKRPDYLTNIWELRVNVKLPVRERGRHRKFVQVRPTEQFFKLNNHLIWLNVEEVIIKNLENNESGVILPEDLGKCQPFKTQLRLVCPFNIIQSGKSCGSELAKGNLSELCLRYMRLWPKNRAHSYNPRGGLNHIIYVPPGDTLEVKCGGEVSWTKRDVKGLASVQGQPLCKYRIGSLVKTMLPRMKRNVNLWISDKDLTIQETLINAPFFKEIGWDALAAELDKNIYQAKTLFDAFEDLQLKKSKGVVTWLGDICREFISLIFGALLISLVLVLCYIGFQIWWNCRTHKRLLPKQKNDDNVYNKKEEMEDLNPSKLTEPVKPGAVVVNNKVNRMTDNKGSSLIYGFTGDPNTNIITTVHTRPQSEGIGYTPTPEDF